MTPIELMADTLVRLQGILESTIGDFSDADMMVRPCPGANHPLWQLGHLASAAAFFTGGLPGMKPPAAPADLNKMFSKETAKSDDAKAFMGKAELMKYLAAMTSATAEAVKKLKVEDLEKPAPEGIRGFAPTVGHLVQMNGAHVMMHVGQFQVARRKLGKPVLF